LVGETIFSQFFSATPITTFISFSVFNSTKVEFLMTFPLFEV